MLVGLHTNYSSQYCFLAMLQCLVLAMTGKIIHYGVGGSNDFFNGCISIVFGSNSGTLREELWLEIHKCKPTVSK